ncbi:hypothetical protein ElyMa_005943900 [Elysia marginata]|uniref:Uncharacterized protein n=1 Tax=Elysia marginata TaxID=1093978 RepID=A0AAV4G9A3_9GAST|nr:hypothetical protein ElyMa_005943900 [Elysia marginata]
MRSQTRTPETHGEVRAMSVLRKSRRQVGSRGLEESGNGGDLEERYIITRSREQGVTEIMQKLDSLSSGGDRRKQSHYGLSSSKGASLYFNFWLFLLIFVALSPVDVTCRMSLNAGEFFRVINPRELDSRKGQVKELLCAMSARMPLLEEEEEEEEALEKNTPL